MTDAEIHSLLAAARAAATRAYAPYSRFTVGAALLGTDGSVHTGCNVENVSFGLTSCAERNALFGAVSAGCRTFRALALAAPKAVTPCGACRQVLAEFCKPDLPVLIADLDPESVPHETTLGALFPTPFDSFTD